MDAPFTCARQSSAFPDLTVSSSTAGCEEPVARKERERPQWV